MRLLLITHRFRVEEPRYTTDQLIEGLRDTTNLELAFWEEMTMPSAQAAGQSVQIDLADVDVCMTYLKFRFHMLHPIDWSGYDGPRVMLEFDAWAAYDPSNSAWHGRYQEIYRRDGFDLMVTTGRRTRDLLRHDGVNAVWMPKAYDSKFIHDLGRNRAGVCTFGTRWMSRHALNHRLGDLVTDISGPYDLLNDRLNDYAGAVVCNMPGRPPFGKVGRGIRRLIPTFVRVYPGVEPMIKTFEVAGAGCAPIVDQQDELAELGFIDGRTCLTYRDFDEAVALIRDTPDERLRELGAAAGDLAKSRHTWLHRAAEIPDLIQAGLAD